MAGRDSSGRFLPGHNPSNKDQQYCKRGHDRTLPDALSPIGACLECSKGRRGSRNESMRDYNLRKTYGIDLEFYEYLLAKQQGKCAICGNPPKKRSLVVDHNHVTGKVRALLCGLCNSGIGMLGDDPERCIKAAEYLRDH